MPSDERLALLVEFFDAQASLARRYQLLYYTADDTIEMYDIKNRKMFLKRCPYPSVNITNLRVGSTVTVFSRQLKVLEYADEFTARSLSGMASSAVGLVSIRDIGSVIQMVEKSGCTVTKVKSTKMSTDRAASFNGNSGVADALKGGCVAIQVAGSTCCDVLAQGACLYASTDDSASADNAFFFGSAPLPTSATFNDCTLCIIKPHAVNAGAAGAIINKIMSAGFDITAVEMFNMDRPNAIEFYEVYKGVVQEYQGMVQELTSGACIALEICAQDAVGSFRQFCGPMVPEIGQHLASNTLRAQFGQDSVQNAVHCTDLAEDGSLEVEYFFDILQ